MPRDMSHTLLRRFTTVLLTPVPTGVSLRSSAQCFWKQSAQEGQMLPAGLLGSSTTVPPFPSPGYSCLHYLIPVRHLGWTENRCSSSRLPPGSLGLLVTPQCGGGRGGHPAGITIWDLSTQWQHGPTTPGLCCAGAGTTVTSGVGSGEAFLVLPDILSDPHPDGIQGFKWLWASTWGLQFGQRQKQGPQEPGLCLEVLKPR